MSGRHLYELLAAAFAAEGVDAHFALMGDGNMHLAVALAENHGVRTIHARHEQCACAMANAYSRVTGRVGVASVTHGPGVTQIMTALTTAVRGEISLVVFAGEAPTDTIWTQQSGDQAPYVRACGAEYLQIRHVKHALDRVREAFCIARFDRRPVVIGVADDLQRQIVNDPPVYASSVEFIPKQVPIAPDVDEMKRIAAMIAQAQRPIVIAGRGVMASGARAQVLELAERAGALVSTTLPARGLFDGEAFSLGIAGGWSSDLTTDLFNEADLVLAIGASLTSFTADGGRLFPRADVVQIDAAPRAVRHNRVIARHHLRCDAKLGATALAAQLASMSEAKLGYRTAKIAQRLAEPEPFVEFKIPKGEVDPRLAVREINRVVPKDWFVVGGSGHNAYFAATNMPGRPPELYVNVRDFGAIGSNLAHAIGVAVARQSRKVLLIEGDGSLLMHIEELETIARHGLSMLIVALNDGAYGAEVHKLRADGHSPVSAQFGRPDFASIARGFKLRGAHIAEISQIESLFRAHMEANVTEIWDVPICGDVLSTPYLRNEKRNGKS